jgi:hypothetical protein
MDYVLFNVPEETTDDLAERILGVIASVAVEELPGFETSVEPSLLPGLSFLETRRDVLDEHGNLCLVRLYEAANNRGSRLLIAGDKLSLIVPGVVEVLRSGGVKTQEHGPRGILPTDEGWSLVGMAFPGWILLFDPEGVSVEKAEYKGDVTVMTLPATSGCVLESLSPTESTPAAMGILIRHILPLLACGENL